MNVSTLCRYATVCAVALSVLLSPVSPLIAPASAKFKPAMNLPVRDHWAELKGNALGQHPDVLKSTLPDRAWWMGFNDPQLVKYVEVALTNSPRLEISLSRVLEARALVQRNIGAELPKFNLTGTFLRLGLPQTVLPVPSPLNVFNVPFQASYEVDLFGKYVDQTLASKRQAEAAQLDFETARISLAAEVAAAYFNLLRADAEASYSQSNLLLLQHIFDLKQSQNKMGLLSFDEVVRSERDVAQAQTELTDFHKQQALFAHQLAILVGSLPSEADKLPRGTSDELLLPTAISAGTPTDMLHRRPDILAQEKRLESARIDVRAARKAFLPTVNLLALLGFFSGQFSDIFRWDNHFHAEAVSVSQPLTDLVSRSADLKVRKARQRQQLEQYRQTILDAAKEVEDNLSLLHADYESLDSNQKRLALTQHNVLLTDDLYRQGLAPHVNVLQGESEVTRYRQLVVQSKMDALIATVNLYKALGGGF